MSVAQVPWAERLSPAHLRRHGLEGAGKIPTVSDGSTPSSARYCLAAFQGIRGERRACPVCNKEKDIFVPLISEIFLGKVFSEPMRLLVSKVNRKSNDNLISLKKTTFIQALVKK